MNRYYDPMAAAQQRAQQKQQMGQIGSKMIAGLGDIAAQFALAKKSLSEGNVKVSQAYQAALNAVQNKLEPLVGAEKAKKIAEQSVTRPQKAHYSSPASYIDQLEIDAKNIENIAANLSQQQTQKLGEAIDVASVGRKESQAQGTIPGSKYYGKPVTQIEEDPAVGSEAIRQRVMAKMPGTTDEQLLAHPRYLETIRRQHTMQSIEAMQGAQDRTQALASGIEAIGGADLPKGASDVAQSMPTTQQIEERNRLVQNKEFDKEYQDFKMAESLEKRRQSWARIEVAMKNMGLGAEEMKVAIAVLLARAKKDITAKVEERTTNENGDPVVEYREPTEAEILRGAGHAAFLQQMLNSMENIVPSKRETTNNPSPSSSPEQQQTKIVNGVTYVKESDGLWHKR